MTGSSNGVETIKGCRASRVGGMLPSLCAGAEELGSALVERRVQRREARLWRDRVTDRAVCYSIHRLHKTTVGKCEQSGKDGSAMVVSGLYTGLWVVLTGLGPGRVTCSISRSGFLAGWATKSTVSRVSAPRFVARPLAPGRGPGGWWCR